jgi:hypothetical protein
MKTYIMFIGLIIMVVCNISMGQEKTFVPKQFLNQEEVSKLPDVIFGGIVWPLDQDINSKKVSISSAKENQIRNTISKCLNKSIYDPNNPPSLITLRNWPEKTDPNIQRTFTQYLKNEYIINICYVNKNPFIFVIGLKRFDGNDIWDMSRDHKEFVPWALNKFFIDQNIGLQNGKQMYYSPNEKGTKDFYYNFQPSDKNDFAFAYMWTNGKIIILRVDQPYIADKKISVN